MLHVKEREMLVEMIHPTIGALPLVGSPLKMSATPVEYQLPPPLKGEHTDRILMDMLGYTLEETGELRRSGVTG